MMNFNANVSVNVILDVDDVDVDVDVDLSSFRNINTRHYMSLYGCHSLDKRQAALTKNEQRVRIIRTTPQ